MRAYNALTILLCIVTGYTYDLVPAYSVWLFWLMRVAKTKSVLYKRTAMILNVLLLVIRQEYQQLMPLSIYYSFFFYGKRKKRSTWFTQWLFSYKYFNLDYSWHDLELSMTIVLLFFWTNTKLKWTLVVILQQYNFLIMIQTADGLISEWCSSLNIGHY